MKCLHAILALSFLAVHLLAPEALQAQKLEDLQKSSPVVLLASLDKTGETGLQKNRAPGSENVLFPEFKELTLAVEFWKKIYSHYTTDHYVLHDRDSMRILAVVDLEGQPEDSASRRRILREQKKVWQNKLRLLAAHLEKHKPTELKDQDSRLWKALGSPASPAAIRSTAEDLRFQKGQKDRFEAGLRRSGRYREQMVEIFRGYGLPEDLTFLPHVESSFNPAAISKAGASGLWQFTRGTGRMFLKLDQDRDERNDPILATRAAAQLLSQNYQGLGNWPLALTAYNHGFYGMRRAVKDTGTQHLPTIIQNYKSRIFGFASKNFYAEFLAARAVALEAEKHFPGLRLEPRWEVEELLLPHYVSIKSLVRHMKVDMREFAANNLALSRDVLSGDRWLPKGYSLRLPKQEGVDWVKLFAAIPQEEFSAEPRWSTHLHTVRAGETLGQLAARYRTTTYQLANLNRLGSIHNIRIGQRLRIPGTATHATNTKSSAAQTKGSAKKKATTWSYTVRSGDTLERIAQRHKTHVREIARLNGLRNVHKLRVGQRLKMPASASAAARSSSRSSKVYVVRSGDTLEKIARRFGTTVRELGRLNQLRSVHRLQIGQRLKVPSDS